jgi:hypothetical protein
MELDLQSFFRLLCTAVLIWLTLRNYPSPTAFGLISRRLLKVPKCEILDRSDFHYFYTIKPFRVDNFVVKILTYYFHFWGSQASFIF